MRDGKGLFCGQRSGPSEVAPYRILVIGVGAVGSLLTAKLAASGHHVAVVGRPEQVSVLESGGILLREGALSMHSRPDAYHDSVQGAFSQGRSYDLVILATKAFSAPPVLEELANRAPATVRRVMTIQNGVGVEEVAAAKLGADRTVAATLTTPVSLRSVGQVVVERSGRGMGVASVSARESVDEWVDLFCGAGLSTHAYADYRALKWSKLMLNIVANANCAVLDLSPAELYRQSAAFRLERAMLREGMAVVRSLNVSLVDLPGSPARLLAWGVRVLPEGWLRLALSSQVARGRGDKLPSLYQDLSSGRERSEVDYLNGAVARFGNESGVAAPVNQRLTDVLRGLHAQRLEWGHFRGRPEAVWSHVIG